MKVKELQAILAACDQDSVVLIAGFETTASLYVAEADLVIPCNSVSKSEGAMSGNRNISVEGEPSIWIGWNNDYRTKTFLDAVANPEEY
ncbi:hypothetical protein LW347_04995 [Pectobacterium polonicum]|uniref:Uncharacterized protein n=1 Tax=Pectobacterium polonicum TaxID=2485124 RepID=A0AAE9NRM9_9GAMM|nr:hypothetical protein [Pectobacterium polonicum]UVO09334.1 hypothetical protein LW347_04995 [Pectobacterium polonicum]